MASEFDLLTENAAELDIDLDRIPEVTRIDTDVDGAVVSSVRWTAGSPRIVFLHGGGQNAHTWDSVILALGLPALAVDLPGHGHSGWREDHDYRPQPNAVAVAPVIRDLAPDAELVVGMSLGGLTTIAITTLEPCLIRRALIVDVSPESPKRVEQLSGADRGTVALVSGPDTYDSRDELIELTAAAAPGRSRSSIRRGVIHNTRELDDGRVQWRYDKMRESIEPGPLWDALSASTIPFTLVRGGASAFVTDDDAAEIVRRRPGTEVISVPGAGHSVQSDAPLELAAIIRSTLGL
ncbi:alpha/beta fold hydrolase [Williamsia muralis]|uniref:Alpha/beta hydrolase n=1 Tax=Williamsia marianensis TaxID=85044 RepID=A0A2G3PLA6_WILMA|nr:alpha/beta hydrolase [Williamsia marianensis]PHV66560.1 alpha/beta hydrolase [Williamsia marianensis]